jgi:hypothetical protein
LLWQKDSPGDKNYTPILPTGERVKVQFQVHDTLHTHPGKEGTKYNGIPAAESEI